MLDQDSGECFIDDDGTCQLVVVEERDSAGHRQALWVRVGDVWYGGERDGTPRVWVEYQHEYMKSDLTGCVMIDIATWRKMAAAVEKLLSERGFGDDG